MGTRSVITVIDDHNTFHVYRHWDGNPESVIGDLPLALEYAWPLPRYEAMDFAAAIVAAWKTKGGGSIYLTSGWKAHGDLEYRYEVRQKDEVLSIEAFGLTSGDEWQPLETHLFPAKE